jgi:hypothetical protein
MSMKQILFNTEMVRAILDGRKSCTRRIVKPQQLVGLLPDKCKNGVPEEFLKEKKLMFKPYCNMTDIELINTAYKAPYQRGDILYVRETWCKGLERYIYRADYSDTEKFYRDGKEIEMKWHPSLHMPKDAARIFLRVTNVRVERLQDITVEDALAEGMDKYIRLNGELDENSIITSFIGIWNSTIKKSDLDRYGWNANPWVWVIEFERCEKPGSEV